MTGDPARPPRPTFHRVLVGTDFTPGSKRAFRTALALARDLGSELHVLHVGHDPEPRPVFFISISPRSREVTARRLQSRMRRRFEDFLRGEELVGVEVRVVHRVGRPHEQIVEYATREAVDLIVVGERAETRAQHLLQHLAFESVGEKVRRVSPCSVLTVK